MGAVVPAQAGALRGAAQFLVPACAGMTTACAGMTTACAGMTG